MASPKPPSYVRKDRTPALGAPNTKDRDLNLFLQNIHERIERLNAETLAKLTSITARLVQVEGGSSGGGSSGGTSDAVVFRGEWDASTGFAPSASPAQGDYYVVSAAGTTDLDGIAEWNVDDWAVYSGTTWQIVRNFSIEAGENVTVEFAGGVATIASTASGAATPTFIAAGDEVEVAVNTQMLYVLPITIDGTLTIDGHLVEVVPA